MVKSPPKHYNRTPFALIKEKVEKLDFTQPIKGSIFDKLYRAILKEYDTADEFEVIQRWDEWKYTTARRTGIDFVITTKLGEYIAVSVIKTDEIIIAKREIDLFFYFLEKRIAFNPENGEEIKYSRGLVISLFGIVDFGRYENINMQNAIHRNRLDVITLLDLARMRIDWENLQDRGDEIPLLKKTKDLKIQSDVYTASKKYFKDHRSGNIVFPCCDGKFLPILKIIEDKEIVKQDGVVLYLAPNIGLLSRAFREFRRDREGPFVAHFVCEYGELLTLDEFLPNLPMWMTSSENLENAYQRAKLLGEKLIIFSTYSELASRSWGDFDLVIYDEAYNIVQKEINQYVENKDPQEGFKLCKDNDSLKAQKRLFITPFLPNEKKLLGVDIPQEITLDPNKCSEVFGDIIASVDADTAKDCGLLTDFRLIVPIVFTDEFVELKQSIDNGSSQDKSTTESRPNNATFRAKAIGILDSLYNIKNIEGMSGLNSPRSAIVFLSSALSSFYAEREFHIADFILRQHRHNINLSITNSISKNIRSRIPLYEKIENQDSKTFNMILNYHFFVEKVDSPTPDCVVLFEKAQIYDMTTQIISQALQMSPNKEVAYIIVPIQLPNSTSKSKSIVKRNVYFQSAYEIIRALKDMGVAQANPDLLREKIIVGLDSKTIWKEKEKFADQIKNWLVDNNPNKDDIIYWTNFFSKLKVASQNIRKLVKEAIKQRLDEIQNLIGNKSKDFDIYNLLSAHIIAKPFLDTLCVDSLNDPFRKKINFILEDISKDNNNLDISSHLPTLLINNAISKITKEQDRSQAEEFFERFYQLYTQNKKTSRKKSSNVSKIHSLFTQKNKMRPEEILLEILL